MGIGNLALQSGRPIRFYRGASIEGPWDRDPQPRGLAEQSDKTICLLGLGGFSKKHVSFSNLEFTHKGRWYLLWPKIVGHICIKPSAMKMARKQMSWGQWGVKGVRKVPCSLFFLCSKIRLLWCLWVTAVTQKLSPWGELDATTHKKRAYYPALEAHGLNYCGPFKNRMTMQRQQEQLHNSGEMSRQEAGQSRTPQLAPEIAYTSVFPVLTPDWFIWHQWNKTSPQTHIYKMKASDGSWACPWDPQPNTH